MPQIIRTSKDLKQALLNYAEKHGYGINNDRQLEEVLFYDLHQIHSEVVGSHRWWNDVFKVAKLPFEYADKGYLLIGFYGAETTGDNSPKETGWEFDWNLFEVEPVEVKTIKYVERK